MKREKSGAGMEGKWSSGRRGGLLDDGEEERGEGAEGEEEEKKPLVLDLGLDLDLDEEGPEPTAFLRTRRGLGTSVVSAVVFLLSAVSVACCLHPTSTGGIGVSGSFSKSALCSGSGSRSKRISCSRAIPFSSFDSSGSERVGESRLSFSLGRRGRQRHSEGKLQSVSQLCVRLWGSFSESLSSASSSLDDEEAFSFPSSETAWRLWA